MKLKQLLKLLIPLGLLVAVPLAVSSPVSAAQQQGYATVEQLAAAVEKRLRKDGRCVDIKPNPDDPAQIDLSRKNGEGGRIRIDVTYLLDQVRGLPPAEAGEAIETFIGAFATLQEGYTSDPARIFANVRSKGYLMQSGGDLTKRAVFQELAGDLIVLYQMDEPTALRTLDRSETGGRSLEELAELGRKNLKEQIKKVIEQRIGDDVSVFEIDGNAPLSAALLLSDWFHGYVAKRFPGGYFLGVPERDFVIAFNKNAPQGLQMARQLMDEFTKDDQNIMSPLLYERRGGKLAVVHEPI